MSQPKRNASAQSRTVRSRLGVVLVVLLVSVGALAFRLPGLDRRPMHGDEANQAYKAGLLIEKGQYRYDPIEHHGPTLYYLTLPVAWLTSAQTFADTTEWTYRTVPVLFGAGVILLLLLLREGLKPGAIVFAAVLAAISPALAFYSRYYIQETLLVFFSFATIVCAWRYLRKPTFHWALLTGASLGFMHATKETSALSYAAMAGAAVLSFGWMRFRDGRTPAIWQQTLQSESERRAVVLQLFVVALAAVLVSVTLYSSSFTNPAGPWDSIRTYATYVARAQSEQGKGIHDKPWPYFLRLLTYVRMSSGMWWSEGLILGLAAVGAVAALTRKGNGEWDVYLTRFLAFYALLLTVMYSAIPYKTPWCVINFLHPMTILAGVGAACLIRWVRFLPLRIAVCLLIAACAVQLGFQAYRANYVVYADGHRNPHVYAHPVIALRRLPERAEDLAKIHPDGHSMLIKVIMPNGDYWPLPWYLREFERVGYWNQLPEDLDAPMIVTSPDYDPIFAENLRDAYQEEYYGLRPGVLLKVYIEKQLWDDFLATR